MGMRRAAFGFILSVPRDQKAVENLSLCPRGTRVWRHANRASFTLGGCTSNLQEKKRNARNRCVPVGQTTGAH